MRIWLRHGVQYSQIGWTVSARRRELLKRPGCTQYTRQELPLYTVREFAMLPVRISMVSFAPELMC